MVPLSYILACVLVSIAGAYKDYTGHKVISVIPKSESHLELLHKLRDEYSIDLWNEPQIVGIPVLTRLRPDVIGHVEKFLKDKSIEYEIAFPDLQRAIENEKAQNAPTNITSATKMYGLNHRQYNYHSEIIQFLKDLTNKYPDISSLETIGKTYENRPIYSVKITSRGSTMKPKPVIILECGIHAREWTSVAAGSYIVEKLITGYATDPNIKSKVNEYEFNIVVVSNPDGYIYTWEDDRLWRKTRSRSSIDWLGVCRGVDANRNFDIDHCGVGTSRKPCEETFCGEAPFSESEARALRDLIIAKKDRLAIYFSLHAFSQLWMTPYGTSQQLPPNYKNLTKIGMAGVNAISKRYNTRYKFGTISNIIYPATGSSVDYAYQKQGIKLAFALELRDTGRYGFMLPANQILPTSEETYDGIIAAINALDDGPITSL